MFTGIKVYYFSEQLEQCFNVISTLNKILLTFIVFKIKSEISIQG